MSNDSREQALIYLTSGAVATVDHHITTHDNPLSSGGSWMKPACGRALEYLNLDHVAAIANVVTEQEDAS